MKKLISLLITLVMVLSMSVTVFAADTVTIYFDKTDTGWATVSAYYYSDDNFSMTAWPGDIMTQVEDNIFSMEVPTAATTIVFNNNGGGSQTGDITIPTDGKNLYTYNTGTWSVYGGGSSGQDTEITVNGTYVPGGTRAERIAVDVVWDAMDFTYSAPSEGTWNPATHAYEGQTSGGWSDNTPAITVTNHSNVAVNATLGFTADVTGVIGTFTEASGTENDNVLELATAEGTEVANAPTAIANFGISGAAIDATQTLGTITVTIAKNVIDTYEKLQAAVNAGGTVKLGGNITLGDENLVVSSSVPVILDLNGYTLTSNNYTKIVVDPDVICTIKNGTVTNTVNMWSAVYNYGTLTVQNCTLNANNY
ncbi:MAG: starch-binding protein, partial [Eubacteriales bacterium]